MKTVDIDGIQVEIGKFQAIEGWKMVHRLTKIAGPLFGSFAREDFAGGIEKVFNNCNEDQAWKLIRDLTDICKIDGKKSEMIARLGEYSFVMKVIKEVLEHNFSEFFLLIKNLMKDFMAEETKDED